LFRLRKTKESGDTIFGRCTIDIEDAFCKVNFGKHPALAIQSAAVITDKMQQIIKLATLKIIRTAAQGAVLVFIIKQRLRLFK
jgi:hypothetical protein